MMKKNEDKTNERDKREQPAYIYVIDVPMTSVMYPQPQTTSTCVERKSVHQTYIKGID